MKKLADNLNVSLYAGAMLASILSLAMLAPSAWAQSDSQSAAEPPAQIEPPPAERVWLKVTGSRVNVRSRADLNSRIVARADFDEVLESVALVDGWHRIVPPKDAFSIAASQYIERLGGDKGKVNVDNLLRIRVGSDVQPRDPLLCEVQTKLEPGAEVKILGELDSEWLKIAPPPGVYVYIHQDFVEQITEQQAQELRQKRAAQLAAPAATEAETKPQPAADDAEEKPAEPPAKKTDTEPAAVAGQEKPAPAEPKKPLAQQDFDARGVLKPSFALPPGPYGLRYMLRNPQTLKVASYIEIPTKLGIDTKSCLGKYVGVRGELFKLDQPSVTVLRVKELVILEDQTGTRETP